MTVGKLKDKYREVFGEDSRSNHKQFLFRRVAWRIQANAEGGLSERARRRALEIANDADLRIRAPKNFLRQAVEKSQASESGFHRSPTPGYQHPARCLFAATRKRMWSSGYTRTASSATAGCTHR